jgi:hypothetical protein
MPQVCALARLLLQPRPFLLYPPPAAQIAQECREEQVSPDHHRPDDDLDGYLLAVAVQRRGLELQRFKEPRPVGYQAAVLLVQPVPQPRARRCRAFFREQRALARGAARLLC